MKGLLMTTIKALDQCFEQKQKKYLSILCNKWETSLCIKIRLIIKLSVDFVMEICTPDEALQLLNATNVRLPVVDTAVTFHICFTVRPLVRAQHVIK